VVKVEDVSVLTDRDYMARALFLAERGRGRTSPNPMVGAVVVSSDGVVIGHGYHHRAGEAHAEVHALDMAGERARGGTLYSTLEPCSHMGRTGPCVVRIIEAGIERVVAAVIDPNPRVSGRGFAFLSEHGVQVEIGQGSAAATELNQPFFTLVRKRRPFVVMKAALSQDGFMAATPGRPTRLTSACADRHAQRVRAEIDAIGVGVGTILSDDPQLTSRVAYRERPLTRIVFDRELRTPANARILSTPEAGPVIIVTTTRSSQHPELRRSLEAHGAQVAVASDSSFRAALQCLGERDITSLLLEGGAALQCAAWQEDVVDFVRLYVTPHVLGSGGVPFLDGCRFSTTALAGRRVVPLGPDVLIEGYVHGPH
jgi:diaminohydroxyphosphoribosylaminopyrimidine deaminase / 5-amino-6-(5-phosphoribosylamino)uracil reductase